MKNVSFGSCVYVKRGIPPFRLRELDWIAFYLTEPRSSTPLNGQKILYKLDIKLTANIKFDSKMTANITQNQKVRV